MTKTPPIIYDDSQRAVIDCDAPRIVAEAFAGAGKTTTALGFTQARPAMRFLYLCFNKANQDEAARRFGSNVECRTTHSLAYRAVGHKYKNRITVKWRPRLLADEMGVVKVRNAAVAQAALLKFFASTDELVLPHHVLAVAEDWNLDQAEIFDALNIARKAWREMCDTNSRVSLPHDAYLKMWAISKPQLRYDCLIVDEAQDTNPVTAQVICNQSKARLLLIGDRYQSIYAFRGALNAMEQFAAAGAHVLKLPRTWRFGAKTASIANALLGRLRGEATQIIGMGTDDVAQPNSAVTILARTNAALFAEAAACMGRGVHWVGGVDAYRVDLVEDARHLFARNFNLVRDRTMCKYRSWGQFSDEVDSTRDAEGKILVRMVNEYKDAIPEIIQSLRTNALPTDDGASLVLTTAHKSKGLDWDFVRIGEDFECVQEAQDQVNDAGHLTRELAQEVNLLYVAITRARKAVHLNSETGAWLLQGQGEALPSRTQAGTHISASNI